MGWATSLGRKLTDMAATAGKTALPKTSKHTKPSKSTTMTPYDPNLARAQGIIGPYTPQQGRIGWGAPLAGAAALGGASAMRANGAPDMSFGGNEPYVQPPGNANIAPGMGGYSSSGAQVRHNKIAQNIGPNVQAFGGNMAGNLGRGFFKDPESKTGFSYSNGRGGVAQHVKPTGMGGQHRMLQADNDNQLTGERKRYDQRIGGGNIWEAPTPSEVGGLTEGNELPGWANWAAQNVGKAGQAVTNPASIATDAIGQAIVDDPKGAANMGFEMTGIPGSYRVGRQLVTGEPVDSNWDYADPLFAIPTLGWGARGAKYAGKAGLKGGLMAGGKIAGKAPKMPKWSKGTANADAKAAAEAKRAKDMEDILFDLQ